MARKLESTLRDFLEEAGRLEPVRLGERDGKEPAAPVLEPDTAALFGHLRQQHRSRDVLLWILIVMLCSAFVFGALAAWRTLDSPAIAGSVFLGSLAFLLSVTRVLGRVWSEKAAIDLALYGLRNSRAEDVPRLVEMVYWNLRRQGAGGRQARESRPFSSFILPPPESTAPVYDDFVLRVQLGPEGEAVVHATSTMGQAEGPLRLDAEATRRAEELAVGMVGDGPRRGFRDLLRSGAPPPRADAQALGERLFGALFPPDVRALYERCLGQTLSSPQRGLRIRLVFHAEHGDTARLAALPWELLCRPPKGQFLARRRSAPVVRSPDAGRPLEPLPVRLPLRVLAVTSSPVDLPTLDLRRERRNVERAWREHPSVRVTCRERITLEALVELLRGDVYHVLHFMGHGGFHPDTGAGVLFFEDAAGRGVPVSGPLLADEIEDFARSLRLVAINACHSAHAREVDGAGPNPFTGLATSLVEAGLTGVVAMQFAVSDPAAIAFSQTLYRRLAAGDPIDTAVTEGRRTLVRMAPDSLEWATPVLFMRSGSGRLIDPESRVS